MLKSIGMGKVPPFSRDELWPIVHEATQGYAVADEVGLGEIDNCGRQGVVQLF